jgi:hypothetical protein
MNIFLRTFNDSINSKTGIPLPPNAPRRGTPEWMEFQDILIQCIHSLGHTTELQPENPNINDADDAYEQNVKLYKRDHIPLKELRGLKVDKRVYVHQCKRDKPNGDLFWMQMHMRNLFTIDTNGWGADNSQLSRRAECKDEDSDISTKFCEELSKSLIASGESKCPQPTKTDEMPNGCILVPVQIPRDYTIKHHSPITVKYFIESICAWANETGQEVAFKMHPNNKCDIDLHMIVEDEANRSPLIHKVEGNIHALIKNSLGIFVINSGTGFESLIHGRPVCTFGTCDYSCVTFNADVRRFDDALEFIRSYSDENRRLGYQFVHWYHKKYAYDVRDKDECKRRLIEYLRRVL